MCASTGAQSNNASSATSEEQLKHFAIAKPNYEIEFKATETAKHVFQMRLRSYHADAQHFAQYKLVNVRARRTAD